MTSVRVVRSVDPERGSGVLLVVLLGGLVCAAGLGLVILSSTERMVAANYRVAIQTLYAAEALAERVLHDVSDGEWAPVLAGTRQSAFVEPGSTPLSPWRQPLDLVAMTTALQDTNAGAGLGPNTPQWRLFASGTLARLAGLESELPVFLVAWVADDPADLDDDPSADSNGVVAVHARAIGFGGVRRDVRLVICRAPVTPPDESDWPPRCQAGPLPGGPAVVRVLSWREIR